MLVSLQAVARRDDAEEPITLLTSGQLTLEEGRSVLTYEEVLDEALPPQPITVTLEDDTLMMERGGDYATQMIFRRGQRYEGQYETPFGSMDLALFCTRLKAQLNEEGGEISLHYQKRRRCMNLCRPFSPTAFFCAAAIRRKGCWSATCPAGAAICPARKRR